MGQWRGWGGLTGSQEPQIRRLRAGFLCQEAQRAVMEKEHRLCHLGTTGPWSLGLPSSESSHSAGGFAGAGELCVLRSTPKHRDWGYSHP